MLVVDCWHVSILRSLEGIDVADSGGLGKNTHRAHMGLLHQAIDTSCLLESLVSQKHFVPFIITFFTGHITLVFSGRNRSVLAATLGAENNVSLSVMFLQMSKRLRMEYLRNLYWASWFFCCIYMTLSVPVHKSVSWPTTWLCTLLPEVLSNPSLMSFTD